MDYGLVLCHCEYVMKRRYLQKYHRLKTRKKTLISYRYSLFKSCSFEYNYVKFSINRKYM